MTKINKYSGKYKLQSENNLIYLLRCCVPEKSFCTSLSYGWIIIIGHNCNVWFCRWYTVLNH